MPGVFGRTFPGDNLNRAFPETPDQASQAQSMYEANAVAAVRQHTEYFARGVSFRNNSSSPGWQIMAAACHSEKVSYRKSETGIQKFITREIYTDADQVPSRKLNSEVMIDDVIYTVEQITNRTGGRVCLHLIRTAYVERTKPGYRR